jgi:hypothetical protein
MATTPVPTEYKDSAVSPTDWARVNPAGQEIPRVAQAINETDDATEKYAQALRERYAQPNWFKMSAAFAKPQLGGFMASLGSAADVLGEQVEQQRAIEPTIYRMRSEIAAKKAGLTQRSEADAILQKEGATPASYLKIVRLAGADSEQAKAVKAKLDAEASVAGTQSTKLGTSLTAQEAALKNPFIEVKEYTPEQWGKQVSDFRGKLTNELTATGKYTPEALAGYSDDALLNAHKAIQDEYAGLKIKDSRTAGDVVSTNMENLTKMSEARYLASSDKMDKLLGLESGQSAVSALFGYVASPTDPSQMSRLSKAARQLQQTDPEAYNNFIVLQKVMQQNLADARSSITNPSNNAQGLLATTYPNLTQPRDSIIKILDLMAHDKSSQARQGLIRMDYKGDPTTYERDDPRYASLKNRIERERLDILDGKTSKTRVPSFYHPYDVLREANPAPAATSQRVNPAAGAMPPGGDNSNMTERLAREREARRAARQP